MEFKSFEEVAVFLKRLEKNIKYLAHIIIEQDIQIKKLNKEIKNCK